MNKVIIRATELDGHLTPSDKKILEQMDVHYQKALQLFAEYENAEGATVPKVESKLIELYNTMGHVMRDITSNESSIRVYSFETPRSVHGEASRLISKLRDLKTRQHEFVYYIQRAYELLFTLSVTDGDPAKKNYIITKTPVDDPVQNYAVHKIPDIDAAIENSVMCVMLRGALLPSMIMSKEMQEYSSQGFVTPFALFKISRDDSKYENNMEYTLNLDNSFFDLESLNGKDLVFADPMNATGGSLVTIVQYLMEQGVKPKSIKFFNAISALKGALRIIRALPNATVYTLWMDPVLNDKAYILPGLGDAGDRINGSDREDTPRNIIQLIADYGSNVSALYRSQVQKIGETVLGK